MVRNITLISWVLHHIPTIITSFWIGSKVDTDGILGIEFFRYGREIGKRILTKNVVIGFEYLINPVNSTRFFEFDFAFKNISESSSSILDISSPRLFSFYLADLYPESCIRMINPDSRDIEISKEMISLLKISNITATHESLDALINNNTCYDYIVSISVIEHICGDDGDTEAIKQIWEKLKPEGKLILTIPVDKKYWIEYRNDNQYGLEENKPDDQIFFFQRFYDEKSIYERLLKPLQKKPDQIVWYGEKIEGTFIEYMRSVQKIGSKFTVKDPLTMKEKYQIYENWEKMPGVGVCGLVIKK